jgi:hypothetical protein
VLPVLVMTLGFSRFMTATMIPSRQADDILSGMWSLIHGIGRVTETLVWDRESAIGGSGRVTAPAAAIAAGRRWAGSGLAGTGTDPVGDRATSAFRLLPARVAEQSVQRSSQLLLVSRDLARSAVDRS